MKDIGEVTKMKRMKLHHKPQAVKETVRREKTTENTKTRIKETEKNWVGLRLS